MTELPSGLKCEMRAIKGGELTALADRALARTGANFDALLRACMKPVDPGPYPWLKLDGPVDWTKILLGDRFAAVLLLRIATLGPEYSFRVQCEKCRELYEWDVDLRDLPVNDLSEESRAMIGAGTNAIALTLNDGHVLHFRLPTGIDEQNAAKKKRALGNKPWTVVHAIANATTEIEGLPQPKSVKSIEAYLNDLYWPELEEIYESMQAHDCGVVTDIETRCTQCEWEQEIKLPFDRDFFRPRRKKEAAEVRTKEILPKTLGERAILPVSKGAVEPSEATMTPMF